MKLPRSCKGVVSVNREPTLHRRIHHQTRCKMLTKERRPNFQDRGPMGDELAARNRRHPQMRTARMGVRTGTFAAGLLMANVHAKTAVSVQTS
jgi:hypothetical protein